MKTKKGGGSVALFVADKIDHGGLKTGLQYPGIVYEGQLAWAHIEDQWYEA